MRMTHSISAVSLALALTACETMGTGTGVGSTPTGQVQAVLSWEMSGSREGTMTAMLSTGETFTGMYFQITSETRADNLDPLWVGWGRPWGGWPHWGYVDPGPEFITYYSGRVLANLQGPNGAYMRCSFQLIRPSSGMAGGGQGQCQLPSGATINTTFPSGTLARSG
jgi:hypothetical protein